MSDAGEEAFGHVGRAIGRVAKAATNEVTKAADRTRAERARDTIRAAGVDPDAGVSPEAKERAAGQREQQQDDRGRDRGDEGRER
ncbi:hypothetical protein [Curtobacterium sp. MCBD17_019]|uniref:hypothetical protein n=1 Tax=Curtobacterium sp. MCBD17_019 TaxID=2175669 RepID=UPI000DA89F06|nr:hypothetical protein [Curtobacterium sp. MCBD17_019]PZE72848.1 hypothetical protein DEI82_14595 [Curtobacterium sp. MCBD17_019]